MLLDHVRKIQLTSWAELVEVVDHTFRAEGWIFRGQRDAEWPLASSLERAAGEFGIPLADLPRIEEDFITRFYRNAHLYISNPFGGTHVLETLSLMQHHGAPTRLLDCSYSFFVAAHFALEAKSGRSGCAVWGIDYHWLRLCVQKEVIHNPLLCEDPEVREPDTFKQIFMSSPPLSFAYQLGPYRLNQRLVIQQGTFLCPGNISCPLEENLSAVPGFNDHVVQLIIPERLRIQCLQQLHSMNMNASTLFPGLDGFGKCPVDRRK